MDNKSITVRFTSLEVSDFQQNLRKLQEEIKKHSDIWVSDLLLHYQTVSDDEHYLEAIYYDLDKEDIANRKEDVEYARELLISPETPVLEIIGDAVIMIRLQNPLRPVELMSNVNSLIESCINALTKYRQDYSVLDFIYHDFINNDALHQPRIHIYLKAKYE